MTQGVVVVTGNDEATNLCVNLALQSRDELQTAGFDVIYCEKRQTSRNMLARALQKTKLTIQVMVIAAHCNQSGPIGYDSKPLFTKSRLKQLGQSTVLIIGCMPEDLVRNGQVARHGPMARAAVVFEEDCCIPDRRCWHDLLGEADEAVWFGKWESCAITPLRSLTEGHSVSAATAEAKTRWKQASEDALDVDPRLSFIFEMNAAALKCLGTVESTIV